MLRVDYILNDILEKIDLCLIKEGMGAIDEIIQNWYNFC